MIFQLRTVRAAAALVILVACAIAGALAEDPDYPGYPLEVRVFSRRVHHIRRSDYYTGSGRANITDGDRVSGAEFTYECSGKFLDSDDDEFYPARWKKEGLSLEILRGVIGSDTKVRKCEFKVLLKNFVYSRDRGKIVTMSPVAYAGLQQAQAERDQSLTPKDLDPTHYPLDVALLRVTWTASVRGMQVGTGEGNLRTPTGANAIDFSIHCPVKVQATPEGRYLAAKWLQPGSLMLLLLRPIDVDGAPGATCQMVTSVGSDVYVRSGGGVKAVPQVPTP